MRLRTHLVLVLPIVACALALAAVPATARYGRTAGQATVTKGHFEYDLFDETNQMFFHFSCQEQRLEDRNGIRETIHCKTNDTTHSSAIIFSPANLFGGQYYWSSDFTGETSKDFHLSGTPSGNLDGWATY
jgi:hypothetical protein